ncbi:MAG: hypothetical protein IT423_01635 [Pirellulaceae bacterium]|nr:hypothetical protein [Pirellulaceae bacterium]
MKELKKEVSKFIRSAADWRTLESWINDAERRLTAVATNRSQLSKLGTALTYEFDKLDMRGRGYGLLCLIAKYRPLLTNVMWYKVQSALHGDYYRVDVNRPETMSLWIAQRCLPIFWEVIKRQYTDPNWLELPDFSGRLKSTDAFVRFVDAHLKRLGITQCMYRDVMKVLQESEGWARKKDISQMAKGLKLVLEGVPEPGKAWRDFCRRALQAAVKKPVDDLFPVAPFFSAIETSASEVAMIDQVVDDAISSSKSSTNLKAWVDHLASAHCPEPPLRLINIVCLRSWIVRSYEDATGENVPEITLQGPLHELQTALLRVINAALRKKTVWDPDSFNTFCQLLPRLEGHYYLPVPIISRCEDYAARYRITETQRQLIDIYYSMPAYSSPEAGKAIKRWHVLNTRIKRSAPRK